VPQVLAITERTHCRSLAQIVTQSKLRRRIEKEECFGNGLRRRICWIGIQTRGPQFAELAIAVSVVHIIDIASVRDEPTTLVEIPTCIRSRYGWFYDAFSLHRSSSPQQERVRKLETASIGLACVAGRVLRAALGARIPQTRSRQQSWVGRLSQPTVRRFATAHPTRFRLEQDEPRGRRAARRDRRLGPTLTNAGQLLRPASADVHARRSS